jgi:hypothetical protein
MGHAGHAVQHKPEPHIMIDMRPMGADALSLLVVLCLCAPPRQRRSLYLPFHTCGDFVWTCSCSIQYAVDCNYRNSYYIQSRLLEAILPVKNNDRYKYTCAAPIRVTMLRCTDSSTDRCCWRPVASSGRLTSYPPAFVFVLHCTCDAGVKSLNRFNKRLSGVYDR